VGTWQHFYRVPPGRSRPACQGKESGRFLKKAAQKLLVRGVMGGVDDNAHDPA
jgi:hypothetical protein